MSLWDLSAIGRDWGALAELFRESRSRTAEGADGQDGSVWRRDYVNMELCGRRHHRICVKRNCVVGHGVG